MAKLGVALALMAGLVACGAPLPSGDESPPVDEPIGPAASEPQSVQDLDGLRLDAETSVGNGDSPTVSVAVTVTNVSDEPAHIEFGACAVTLRAYRTPDRSGEPVAEGAWGACPAYLAVRDLEPGQSLSPDEFRQSVPVAGILWDLPDGRYYFTAAVRINWTTVEVPAGEAELSTPPNAFPPDDVVITCDPPVLTEEEIDRRLAETDDPLIRGAIYRSLHRGNGELVPGFGGLFVDRDDNTIFYVYLLEPSQELAEQAIERWQEIFGSQREVSAVRPVQGQYSYSQLKEWIDCWDHRQPRLSTTSTSGISEGDNRIIIGVVSERDAALAERELEALGIPREAATISVAGRVAW